MKKMVVLTGAGMSVESGLQTFRDANGLWEGYNVMDVATPEAFERDPRLVLEFYNQRRRQLLDVLPNNAHYNLKDLEKYFNIHIITQNVDDLHERAGSSQIVHLHGELRKVRSTTNEKIVLEWLKDLYLGDVLVIIGTSMQVYPAASLIHYVFSNTPIYFIDPAPSISKNTNTTIIKSGAQQGTKQLIKMLVG